jgi:hypothetical protein
MALAVTRGQISTPFHHGSCAGEGGGAERKGQHHNGDDRLTADKTTIKEPQKQGLAEVWKILAKV